MDNKELHNFVSYSKDPVLFLKYNFYGFSTKTFKNDLLKMDPYEIETMNNIFNNRFVFIGKSRQMHGTTMAVRFMLYCLLFKSEYKIMFISHNSEGAARACKMLENAFIMLPEYIKPHNVRFRKNDVENNFSYIKFVSANSNAGKGERLDAIIVDEAAYVKNFTDIWMAGAVCLTPETGKFIVITSPNPYDINFSQWAGQVLNSHEWCVNILPWYVNSVYGKNKKKVNGKLTSPWYEEQKQRLNDDEWLSIDLDCDFNMQLIKKPKSRVMTFRIDNDLEERLSQFLIIRGIEENKTFNTSDYIRELIEKDLSTKS